MKRNIFYLVLCVNLLVSFTGCYEDKSTEATHFIPEIVIDTTGIGEMKTLKRFERLQINPKISKEGTDPSQFSYKWMLSLAPVQGLNNAYECISEEPNLDVEITRDDDENPYCLWLQVTDNTTELRKDMIWDVRVLAPYGEGLLVAEEVEGGTDLALIESKQFSEGYQDEPLIRHGIFSNSNGGKKINANLTQMSTFKENNKLKYYILLGKGEDKYLLLKKTYETRYRNEEGFVEYAVENVNPTQFIICGQAIYLVNDNYLHWMWTSSSNGPMQWGAPIPFQGEYVEVDKMLASGGIYSGPGYSFYYVPSTGRFKTLYNTTMRWDLADIKDTPKDNWGFDPQNCPDLEMIYGGLAPEQRVCAIMKNKENGKYFVIGQQTKNGYMAGTISDIYLELPECEINNAIAFASHELGGVIYFATKHDIYSIILNAVPIQVNKIHSFTDEITHMSIFRQARNTAASNSATLEGGHTQQPTGQPGMVQQEVFMQFLS